MSDIQAIHLKDEATPERVADINLSVFDFPWRWKSWYGFWKNIGYFFKCVRAGWQRATQGYCPLDVCNCGDTIIDHTAKMLIEYRNKTNGWPANDFETYEEWIAYIDEIIDLLLYARQNTDDLNPYYEEVVDECWIIPHTGWTTKEHELYKLYGEEERKICAKQREAQAKAFTMLGAHVDQIWW
jgi:hypothetical protein